MSLTQFRKVKLQELKVLNLILKDRLPKSGLLCNIMHCVLNEKYSPKVQTEYYTLGWDPSDAGAASANVAIIAIQTYSCLPERLVVFSTPEDVGPDYLVILEGLLDWNHSHTFGEVVPNHAPYLCEIIKRRVKLEGPVRSDCYNYLYLDGNSANLGSGGSIVLTDRANVEDISVRKLRGADAKKIDEAWVDFRHEGTHELLQDAIETLPTAGVFIRNELISWALVTPVGSINALHTVESYRGNGFALLTMKALAQENLTNGLISIAHVDFNNTPSQNIMKKANFVYSHDVNWMGFVVEK